MTVWRKLENEDCYAVAIYNLSSGHERHLSVEVGELVQLVGESEHWYWGRSVNTGASGALPKSYVQVTECHVEKSGETVVTAGGGGVVHDIAVTLREWLRQWKILYTRNDDRFKFIEVSMRALLQLRGQAASGALPQDQLRKVARTALFTIDKGNRMLGMELAVRTASGQLVDPTKISAYKLNAMHDEANARIDKNMETTPSTDRPSSTLGAPSRSYKIVVRVHNFVCRMADSAELLLALHSAAGNKITESALLRWPPVTAAAHASSAVLFTDLGPDIKKEKLFLVCHVVRIGAMEPQNVDHRRSTISAAPATHACAMRRPFGVACADVTRHLAADNPDKDIQLPFYACEKENMDTLLKKVISNRDLKDAKHPQGMWVSLQLVEENTIQVHDETNSTSAIARKMGFPEVILPGDARNDLYVTLAGGTYSRAGGKSSERNIEMCVRVLDSRGRQIPGVISVGAGVPRVNEYTSLVYYHDDRPRWQETFKVCLNIEAFKEAHLVFLARHRSTNEAKDRAERHFALSYLRLMQREGTTTPDTTHNLCVYKIEHKSKSSSGIDAESEAGAACLALPSRRDELPAGADRGLTRGPLTLLQRDCLAVATKLCSTKLTQREEILGVLKWNTHHAEGSLRAALTRLLRVPSEELVKFLQDILDALFRILTQVEEEETEYTEQSYAVLVLDCLLCVIALVGDHKYQHFQPVLLVYIETSFCDALAYEKLISIMVWAIRSAERGEAALKRLLLCMKCLESLARLVVRSRELRAALGDRATVLPEGEGEGAEQHYCYQLEELLKALVWLMRCGDHALTCQGSALKYLPHAIPHLMRIYPATELSAYCVHALEALPLTRLAKQRLMALLELVRGPLAAEPQARALLLPHLADTLQKLMRSALELERDAVHKLRSEHKAARLLGADSARRDTRAHRTHREELCVETLGEVVSLLARDDVGPVEADRCEVARCLLPTVLRTAAAMLRDSSRDEALSVASDQLLRRLICVLLEMVRQMSREQYEGVARALVAAGCVLADEAVALVAALLRRPVFRAHWADMLHLQHCVMLHALRLISTTLTSRLHGAEDADIDSTKATLREWFVTTGLLAAAPSLQLETLPAARRQRARALYGDLRRCAATALQDMWYSLGDHKHSFIPFLVGPFLEVSFLRDDVVRNTTIPLFFDMMQTEYTRHVVSGDCEEGGELRALESELIDKLDVLAEAGRGDAEWRQRFVSLCGALVNRSEPLRSSGAALVAAAARQLDALLQYRAAATPHRMHLVSGVLRFYEQIERPHMYIRYVHRLAAMHKSAAHWTEAGLALKLHAKLLEWSDEPLPPRLRHPHQPAHSTHRELKKALYLEVAELVSRGRQWELAVDAVEELVQVFKQYALGYAPLAEMHAELARLYSAMMQPRLHPTYFRVIYHGKGFPTHLRVPNGFVYRGNECDKLHDFEERMLDEWPDAEILLKLDPPGEEVTESNGQYLQINAVEPVMGERLKRLSGKPVDEQILQYYEHNNVDKFVFSRPFHRPEEALNGSSEDVSAANEFATRWLERTELEITDTLPGILRWFPVQSTRTYWVSPLQLALETLARANRELKALARDARSPDAPLHPLTMRLCGILDSPVQGGLVNYERAFMTPAYEARHPEDRELLQRLRDSIAEQVPLLKYALEVHCAREPAHVMHGHLLDCFRRLQQHVHQRYGRKMCDFEPETPEVQLRIPLREGAHDATPPAAHRVSDISTGNESVSKSKFSLNNAISWTRNSSSGTLTPRREKKRVRKSEVGIQSGSLWYTSAAANGVSSAVNVSLHNALYNNNSANNSPNNSVVLNNTSSLDTPGASPLRELRQELFTERPLRAEAERERRLSQRTSLLASGPPSNRDSVGTTDSNQDDEEPPPLPQKQCRALDPEDNTNNNANNNTNNANNNADAPALPARYNYDLVLSPRQSYLYQSKRRPTIERGDSLPPFVEKAPTPPPKKKNQSKA